MKTRRLGNIGLRVSVLGLGTLTWGRDTLDDEYATRLKAFLEAGGDAINTSPTYDGGQAQQVLGALVSWEDGRVTSRDDLVVVSKSGVLRRDNHSSMETSRSAMLGSLEVSLRELGTDCVDLWMLQIPDEHTNFDAVLSTLVATWQSGKARFVRLSNHNAWQMACATARLGNTFGEGLAGINTATPSLVAVISEYSLLNRQIEVEILPTASTLGIGVSGWSALGRGVLNGRYRSSTPPDSYGASLHLQGFMKPYLTSKKRRVVESVATAASGLGESTLAISLTWVLSRPGLSSAIVGAHTAEQLHQVLRGLGTRLPHRVSSALDEVTDPINPL